MSYYKKGLTKKHIFDNHVHKKKRKGKKGKERYSKGGREK